MQFAWYSHYVDVSLLARDDVEHFEPDFEGSQESYIFVAVASLTSLPDIWTTQNCDVCCYYYGSVILKWSFGAYTYTDSTDNSD